MNKNTNSNRLFSSFDFSNFDKQKPQHRPSLDINFLEWFIGFTEGDGSFGFNKNRLSFVINQADIEVLRQIRTKLGFGIVTTFVQNNITYARYVVKEKKRIESLIALFNGNIHLEKVQNRFQRWVKQYNINYGTNISLKPRRNPNLISLKNAWLAGFFDAEGCCYAGKTEKQKIRLKFQLRLKASIDQQFEFPVLKQIASLLEAPSITIRNVQKSYFRVEVTSKTSLGLVVNYLNQFKLRTRKKDAFAVWRRIVNLYRDNRHLDLNSTLLKKRIDKVQNLNQVFKQNKDYYLIK